jgi:tetratricopeptide (TPR) repeat protein
LVEEVVPMKPVIIIAIAFVLLIPINAFALEASPKTIDMSTSDSPELIITGEIEQYLGTTRLLLTIVSPDNSQTDYDVRIVGNGPFSESIVIDSDWIYGDYTIYGNYGEIELGSTSFTIEKPYDPRTDVKAEVIESSPQIESKETIVESNKLEIPASFVDQTKDPQSYVDRYENEPSYKKWFDDNYSEYSSIHQAVGLESPTCGAGITLVNGMCQTIITNSINSEKTKSTENFPDPLKAPNDYIQRYNSEPDYKKWFDSVYDGKKIERVVEYYETHVDGFPDNSKSPFEYVKRYMFDSTYREWFKSQFPSESIRDVLGIDLEDNSKILNEIGMEFYDQENDKDALIYFRQALADDPYNIDAHNNAGDSLFYLGDYGTSNTHYNEVLKLDEDNIHALLGLAENNKFQERLRESIKYYTKVLKLEPENKHALAGFGAVSVSLGDSSGIEYLEKAIAVDPTNVDFKFDKAYALSELGEYEEAIKNYEFVLKDYPNDVAALNNVGWIYAQFGENSKAALYFEKVLEIDPNDEYASANLKDVQDGTVVKSAAYESKLEEQRKSSTFPEVVNSRCDLVYLIIKEYDASPYGLLPSDETIEKMQLKTEEYQQRISDEPWKMEDITLEFNDELKIMLVDSIMKKYNIDKKFRTGMFDLIKTVGVLDQDYARGLFQLDPEEYGKDVECGKLLKLHYFDELNEINVMTYGASNAKKIETAINEAIENAESKKSSSPISTFNSKTGNTDSGGGCLIATATYGSELAPQVQQLRELRDNQLLGTTSGTNFMNLFNGVYYSFSPVIADYERENPVFKEMVKVAITPMITSLSLMEYAETETEVVVIGISLIMLNVMMYVGVPIIAVMRFRK